ncbi:MAG: hypothetical protein ACLRUM_00895 [Veillonella parvula]
MGILRETIRPSSDLRNKYLSLNPYNLKIGCHYSSLPNGRGDTVDINP